LTFGFDKGNFRMRDGKMDWNRIIGKERWKRYMS
jgi:hypothetical protein